MALFTGINSPCCNKEFAETDDVVVCPECGTPHHRDCYAQKGKCCNAGLHSSDFIWKTPVESAIHGYKAVEEAVASVHESETPNEEDIKKIFEALSSAGMPRDSFEIPDESFERRDIYGVSEREITSFIGDFNPYFLARFRRMAERNSKVSLNIFAGIFFPYYQFYYRHRTAGVLFAVIDFLLSIPNGILYIMLNTSMFTAVEMPLLTNVEGLRYAEGIMQYIKVTVCILTGLFYDYFYLRWMTRRIIEIRSQFGDDNLPPGYYSALTAAGKPGILKMILDYFIVITILFLFLVSFVYIYAF